MKATSEATKEMSGKNPKTNSLSVRRVVVAKHPPKTSGNKGGKNGKLPVIIRDSATLRSYLRNRHKRLQSWHSLVFEFPGVKRGTLQRFATTDYEPKREDVRRALGLPVLRPYPVCPYCGNVYMTRRRIEYKPRARRRKKRRPVAR